MDLIDDIEREQTKKSMPKLHVGDTVEVHYLIKEGEKERIQLFVGTVISIKGRGIRRTFTVRRIVQGEGVGNVVLPNDLRDDRLPRGHHEGPHGALKHGGDEQVLPGDHA